MPMGPPSQSPDPKSACAWAVVPIDATYWADFVWTGRWETSARQKRSAGNIGQLGACERGEPPAGATIRTTVAMAPAHLTHFTVPISTPLLGDLIRTGAVRPTRAL